MGDREPEVDPYFEEHMGKSFKETKDAIIRYLELYLDPDIISTIAFVDSSFFFEDDKIDEYRRKPRFQGFEKVDAPEAGKIILDVSFIQNNLDETKTVLHTVLLFCILFSYLREHPNDKSFVKGLSYGTSKGTMHEFTSCFFWEMFKKTSAAKVKIIYVPLDLHAIYNSEDASPDDIQIVKRKNRMVVVHSNNYSFVVKHTYQQDEYDGLSQSQLESIISKWDIDKTIKVYKSGTRGWLNDQVFASTIEWADDGFVYALREGTDDLVNEFVKRDTNLIQRFFKFDDPDRFKGNYYQDELARDEKAIIAWALRRNNKNLDDAFLQASKKIDANHLLSMASAHRFDLLLQIPVKNINIDREQSIHTFKNFLTLSSENLIEKGEDKLLEKIFVRYWPLKKNLVARDEETMIDFIHNVVTNDIRNEAIVYRIIKKIDPASITAWLKSIKPPTFTTSRYTRTRVNDWIYFIRDDVYGDLERINPISDEDIQFALSKLATTCTYYNSMKTQCIENLQINSRLKERMLNN